MPFEESRSIRILRSVEGQAVVGNDREGASTVERLYRKVIWHLLYLVSQSFPQICPPFSSIYLHQHSGCLTDQQVRSPVDFQATFSRKFSRICSFIDIYRAGSLIPGITLILFSQAIAELKDIYQGLIAPISINPGLLQDVLLAHCEVQEFWASQKISRRLC